MIATYIIPTNVTFMRKDILTENPMKKRKLQRDFKEFSISSTAKRILSVEMREGEIL